MGVIGDATGEVISCSTCLFKGFVLFSSTLAATVGIVAASGKGVSFADGVNLKNLGNEPCFSPKKAGDKSAWSLLVESWRRTIKAGLAQNDSSVLDVLSPP